MVAHLVVLVIGRDVPRDVWRQPSQEAGCVPQLGLRVVEAGHGQRHDFHPEAHLHQPLNRLQDVVHFPAQLAVIAVRHGLEVDLVGIRPGADVLEHLLGGVAVGDKRRAEPRFASWLEDVDRPLGGD